MPEGQAGQDPCGLKLAEAGGQDIGRHTKIPLQIAVALWSVKQPLDDEQRPPRPDNVKGSSQAAHAVGSASGFIQNGE